MTKTFKAAIALFAAILFFGCQKDYSIDGPVNGVTPIQTDITAKVQGRITDELGNPVKGATVAAGTSFTTTNVNGEFLFSNAALKSSAAIVKVTKAGYFAASRTFRARQGEKHYVDIQLLPKQSIGSINGTSGGTINVANGSSITLPANGVVVESSGTAYTGMVNVQMAWIDPSKPNMFSQMPGDLRGIDAGNTERSMQSYGMLAVELSGNGGEKLQIAAGKKSTLNFPIPSSMTASAPATIALWSFDETTGLWKQEGTATKNGNKYTGDVSHFSYWNCDIALTSTANFSATFTDQNGQPLTNIHVMISYATGGYTGAHGIPDSSGYMSGNIPAGQALVLSIMGNWQCSTPVFTKSVGPFTQGSTNNLGTIVVNLTGPLATTVSGTAVDCSNNPLTNGTAEVYLGYQVHRAPITNGTFSVPFLNCGGTQTITYVVTDNSNNQQSSPVTATINAGANNVGAVTACGVSSLKFINYTIDGTSYALTSPPDYIMATDSSMGQGNGNLQINGYKSTAPNTQSFNISMGTVTGVGSVVATSLFIASPTYSGSINVAANPVTVNITEYGPPGSYVAGNFSASFTDASSVTHTLQVSFRAKRQ